MEFVDIDDIAEDGLLHDDGDRIKIAEKFREAKVDGLFFPHGNFGTEYEVARLAKDLNVPVLLWGPRDERPEADVCACRIPSAASLPREGSAEIPDSLYLSVQLSSDRSGV